MTDIEVIGNRARTLGKADLSVHSFRRNMEGMKTFLKDGSFSFEATPHNMSLWAYHFPAATITDNRRFDTLFEGLNTLGIRPKHVLKREPLPHQQAAFDKLKDHTAVGLFYDPGAGKSKSLTDLATYKYCEGVINAMIIWTPNALVTEQWSRMSGSADPKAQGQLERDIHHSINWLAWEWGKTKKRMSEYDKLKAFSGFQVIVMNIDAGKTPAGKELMNDFIKHHKGKVLFAVDESHLIKTKTSGRAKAAFEFGAKVNCRAILTGTPIGKDLLDMWSQFIFLDEKIIGIRYKTAFMNAYCVTKWNGFGHQVVGHRNIDQFYGKIDPYIFRITQKELGLEKMYDEFEFTMHEEQKSHYNSLKTEFLTLLDNGEFLTAANAISALTRMQQVSNGYLVRADGSFQELPNARLDALDSWLETISDDKIMIWCRFKQDARIICNHFKKISVDLSGNVESSDRIDNKNRFLTSSEIRFAIGTPDAAGTGMDGIQDVCNRALRYSLSYNLILFDQAENRTSRIGGTGTSFYTDLIGKATVDRRILRNLQGKKDLSKLALDDIRNLVNE